MSNVSEHPFRAPSSPGMPAITKEAVDAADTQRRQRSLAGSFDDLVAANLSLVRMGRRLIVTGYVVLGAVLLQSGVTLYAVLRR